MKFLAKLLGGLFLLLVIVINVAYWQDTTFMRRFVTALTPAEPGDFSLAPLESMGGGPVSALPMADAASQTIDPDALEAARAFAEEYESFSFIVVHKGRVQMEWYAPGWDKERVTQSQSMHKSVAALLVGAAIEDGHIASIDDPIEVYVPVWEGTPQGAVTIKDLLTMSSGLEAYPFSLSPFADKSTFRLLFTENREDLILQADYVEPPQSKFEYNELNVLLIGMILEAATGQRYTDYLDAALWQPMGGQSASTWLDRPGGFPMTSCCILAPAMDWARIGELMRLKGAFNGTQIIPAAWIDAMSGASAKNPSYGYLTWRAEGLKAYADEQIAKTPQAYEINFSEELLDPDMILLMGLGGQRVFISDAHDLVVVRLGPAQGYQPLKPGWDNAYLVNSVIRGIQETP